jgi:hypothetical protein
VLSDRYCGGGRFCREGWYCSGGGCRSRAADAEAEAARRRQQALEEERRRLEDEARRQAEEQRLNEERRRADAERRAADEKRKAQAAAERARNNSAAAKATPCSTITGPGMTSGGPCPPTNQKPATANQKFDAAKASPAPTRSGAPSPRYPRVVVLSPPQCRMCDVLKTMGEVVPDLAEKLNGLKYEAINDAEPPLFDGGPNTLRPYLPRRPLAPVTGSHEPLEAITDMKDIASGIKALSDLADKTKEADDYAQVCQDDFIDAAWTAFTAKEGSYFEKTKAARDSLKNCWKEAVKHIEDTLTKGMVDPATPLEDSK